MTRTVLSLSLFTVVVGIPFAAAQENALQPEAPLERALDPKDPAHEYAVTSPGNQAFTIVVDQQGIDVVVAIVGPDGTEVALVDHASENDGTGGAELAEVTALDAGQYTVRVSPFDRPDARPARYNIKLTAMRNLTGEERANAASQSAIAAVEQEWETAVDEANVGTLARILRNDGFGLSAYASATRTRAQIIKDWEARAAE